MGELFSRLWDTSGGRIATVLTCLDVVFTVVYGVIDRVFIAEDNEKKQKINRISLGVIAGVLLVALVIGGVSLLSDGNRKEDTPTPEGYYTYDESLAEDVETLTYEENADGSGYTVTGFDENADIVSLVIPREHEGKPVTAIGDSVFNNSDKLESLSIPETVTRVGEYSIAFCDNLTHVDIPDSITEVGEGSFFWCTSLSNVRIPGRLEVISDFAFADCEATENIYVNEDNPSYRSVNGIVFSKDMKTLVRYPCGRKDSDYTVPKAVEYIEIGAFSGSPYLTSLSVAKGSRHYRSVSGVLFDTNETTLVVYPSARKDETYNIPGTVRTIASGAFCHNKHLKALDIQEGVTTIGKSAFNYTKMTTIKIPKSVLRMYDLAFASNFELKTVIFADGIELADLPDYAFYRCTSLSELIIPDSVTEIGESAFFDCASLATVQMPEDSVSSLKTIGARAFRGCTSLSKLIIPDSVTEIGANAFRGCTSLRIVEMPEDSVSSLKTIGAQAFHECTSLSELIIPNSVTTIEDDVFCTCTSLQTLKLPDRLTVIPEKMCNKCESLTGIIIPASVTEIGKYAFRNCTSLATVQMPEDSVSSLKTIGKQAFQGCTSLSKLIIPASVTEIGEFAFFDCASLATVQMPEDSVSSLKTIGKQAFQKCTSLSKLIIPDSVTEIGEFAFFGSKITVSAPKDAGDYGYTPDEGVVWSKR